MNRKLPTIFLLKKSIFVILAIMTILSPAWSQNDTICSDALKINSFQSTLFSDSARWHVFVPPNAGTVQISSCNLGFTEYYVFDDCIQDTARVSIDSLSVTPCNNGEIETYPVAANDSIFFEVLDGDGLNDNKVSFEFIPTNTCADGAIPLPCNSPLDNTTVGGTSSFNSIYYRDCLGDIPLAEDYQAADHVFEVQINGAENIFFKLSNLSADLELFLYDDLCNGNAIECIAANTSDDNEKIIGPLTLPTGTYHLVVDAATSDIEGSFTIEAMCPDCNYTGPDFNIGRQVLCNAATFDSTLLSGNAFHASDYASCYSGTKSFDGQDNLYFVDIPVSSSFVTFSINNLEHDYDVFAFDSNFDCIINSTNPGTESETIILQNTFGRYYFVVDSEDCGINSEFTILVSCDCDLDVNIIIEDDAICENEVTTITGVATTGNGPYTFTWSDMTEETTQDGRSSIDVNAGTHCVTVSDNFNCGRVRCITVEDNGTPFINEFIVTPASCSQSNGVIEVDVTGDFSPNDTIKYSLDSITFQTENVFSNLSAGPYTVYTTNTNGCASLDETIVDQVPPPTISNIETTFDTCRTGIGSLTIIANSPNGNLQYSLDGETFQTSNTFNNLVAGIYSASIIDNSNCIITQSTEVFGTPAPQIDNVTITADTCGINSGQIEVQASGGEGTVLYSIDNINFQTDPVFSFISGGTYDISVKDDNDCPVSTQAFVPTLGAPEVVEMVRDTGACAGNSVAFSVEARVEGQGTIAYQWQIQDNNDAWVDINNDGIYSGAQTNTLVVSDVTGLDNRKFRASLSSEFCSQAITSNVANLRVDGPLTLTQGPLDQGLCSGIGTFFTAIADSESSQAILYQWELSTNSGVDWSNLPNGGLYSGSNTDTLRISNASNLNNFMYRVSIFSDFCESITSEPALLQIERPMSVTAQPNNFNVCSGDNVSFSFTINSNGFDTPQFQWQTSANGGNDWSNIFDDEIYVGTSTTTLNVNNVDGLNDYIYRAAVIGGFCDTLFTNPALLRVTGQVAISSQPSNTVACIGQTASFSFSTGNTDTDNSFNIQWEASTDNGQSFEPISDGALYTGTNTATLNINNVNDLDNYRYRVVLLSDTCDPSVSEVATLTVVHPLTIDVQPVSSTVCGGQNSSFSIQTSNNSSPISYQWQISTDGAIWSNLSNDNVYNGTQTATLSISNTSGLNNIQYRVIVQNEACPSTTSDVATLTTQGPISFGNQPQDVATCDDGNSVTFSAIATNEGAGEVDYQWEISDDNTGFSPISDNEIYSGTNGTTLTINDITGLNNKRFRLSASTSLCSTVYSSSATLLIEGPVSITSQIQDVMSCSGEAVTFGVEATSGQGGILAYQWQINIGEGWDNLQNDAVFNGVSTNTLSVANTTNLNGSQFRVIIITELCTGAVVSEVANLMVQGEVNIAQHPQDRILCAGESTSFSTSANTIGETDIAYQWQISTNNGSDWTDLTNQSPYSDVQTPTLNISTVNDLNNYQYRAKIFSEFCDELFTNPAILTVEGPIGIIEQPLSVTTCSGNSTMFQIDANNTGTGELSYQWFISTDNGNNYFELTESNFNYNGTSSPTLNVLNTTGLNDALFQVTVSSPNCPTMTSQAASLSVEGPISIITQPSNQAACDDGAPIIFSAMIENQNSGTISYQWEASSDGINFNPIEDNSNYSGSNSPTLTIQNAGTLNGYQYRLVAQTAACMTMTTDAALLEVNAPIIQNIEVLEDTCGLNNGSIIIMADGGFGDLLYSLNDDNYQTNASFNNLASTTYDVFVQDENGCTVSQPVQVPSFGAPNIMDLGIVADTCGRNVGSLTIIANGSTPDLMYSINGGDFQSENVFNNLSADTYTIVVQDGFACSTQVTTDLTEAGSMLSLTVILEENSGANPNDGIICTAEEVILNAIAAGGNDDYTYTWNNGLEDGNLQTINPMNSTTYVVTATDGNFCFAIDSISLTVQESPIASTNSNSPVCEGEAIIFSAAGGSVYEWTGPNGFSSNAPNPTIPVSAGQNAGTYTLTINDQNNCPNTASLEVDVIGPSNYPAMVSVTDDFICEGEDDETARLTGNLYPEIDARGIWFTNATGVDIDGVVSANATATNLNYGANTFIWALSNETCDEFASDSVTVFLEPLPIALNDTLSSFENVPIDSFSVILNDNVENLIEWEIDLVKQPERAEVTYLGNGKFSVKAEETFFGELRFSYRLVSLSCNRFAEAEVIINIKDNNEAVHCVWTPQVDGPNWEICRAISPDNTLRIIDRYGTLVYSASPYLNDWDGTSIETGQPVPTGTYYFVLTQNKETESDDQILGTVILLR